MTFNKLIKKIAVVTIALSIISSSLVSCGGSSSLENAYNPLSASGSVRLVHGFSQTVAVPSSDTIENSSVNGTLAESYISANISLNSVNAAKNVYEQLYPASTTKILTCYIVATSCADLDETLVVSDTAMRLEAGSSVCGLNVGDVISVRDALYGMMLCSGNEAANALAEYVSGDISSFADLMNDTARKLGATSSHFTNANGLHDENHYTTCYDLYLIFQKAIQNDTFYEIVTSKSYDASYKDASGGLVSKHWESTNRYLMGYEDSPKKVTVLGGKTGTTNAAGYCLVLLSERKNGNRYVNIVLKAGSQEDLYSLMNELLSVK